MIEVAGAKTLKKMTKTERSPIKEKAIQMLCNRERIPDIQTKIMSETGFHVGASSLCRWRKKMGINLSHRVCRKRYSNNNGHQQPEETNTASVRAVRDMVITLLNKYIEEKNTAMSKKLLNCLQELL